MGIFVWGDDCCVIVLSWCSVIVCLYDDGWIVYRCVVVCVFCFYFEWVVFLGFEFVYREVVCVCVGVFDVDVVLIDVIGGDCNIVCGVWLF